MENEKQSAVMTIEVSLSRQPEPYQSIRVSVSLPVFITPDDDYMAILDDNLSAAKFALEEQMDREFESYDQPAPYSPEPRYVLALIREAKLGAILPDMNLDKLPGGWRHARTEAAGHRLAYVRQKAAKDGAGYNIVDASDGNLEQLPAVTRFVMHANNQAGMAVLAREGNAYEGLKAYEGYFSTNYYLGLPETVLARAIRDAADWELPFFDCTDGDFGKLPAPAPVEREPEEDVPFEGHAPEDDDDE